MTVCHVVQEEPAAWKDLIGQLRPQLSRYRRWAEIAADVEDLQQELQIALWEALHDRPPKEMPTWCRAVGIDYRL